jgi:hypothetical protein
MPDPTRVRAENSFCCHPATLQGRGAGGLLRVPLTDLRQRVFLARLCGERQHQGRRREHEEICQGVSAGTGEKPATDEVHHVSGKEFNTIHANNFHFYEEVNHIVQEEPNEALDPETLGLLAAIGIEKGKPFAPDARMKKILTEAVAVGNAAARALTFRPRNKQAYFYPKSAWFSPMAGGSYQFLS